MYVNTVEQVKALYESVSKPPFEAKDYEKPNKISYCTGVKVNVYKSPDCWFNSQFLLDICQGVRGQDTKSLKLSCHLQQTMVVH